MKNTINIFLVFVLCSVVGIKFSYSQWVQQTSGVTAPLYNVQFVNLNTGWVTGSNNVILKTTDSGLNWIQQPVTLSGSKNLYGLSMIDANTGYIAGWFETILKTTNGGATWIVISDGPYGQGNSNNGVSFVNAQTGWICSFLGRVLRTTNAGETWDTFNIGNTGPLEDIQFLNTLTGWVCGDVGNLKKSTDGGLTWIGMPLLTTANFDGMHFINVNTGWVVGEQDNMVFRTTNGGGRWDTVATLPGGSLQYSYVVYFSSAQTGWIGGTNNRLFKSTNGGFSWVRENAIFNAFFWRFCFLNDSIGWVAGGTDLTGHGTIIHTTTSGEPVGVVEVEGSVPSGFKLCQNYPNPFNAETAIEYEITERGFYKLEIYDILGRKVDKLMDEYKERGKYKTSYNAGMQSSGSYFYILSGEGKRQVRKFVLLK